MPSFIFCIIVFLAFFVILISMQIKYLGHSSFLIKSRDVKILTDPFNSKMVGLPFVKQDVDIVTISHHHEDHSDTSSLSDKFTMIDWPGEFEIKGVRIFGYRNYHDKEKGAKRGEVVIYKYEIEGVSVAHCGDLGCLPDSNFIDSMGNIDVLMVPIGGTYTLDPEEAIKFTKKIDPFVVMPMHYKVDGMNMDNFGHLATLDDFLTDIEFEVDSVDGVYKVSKEDLRADTTKCVVFKS